MKIIFTIIVIFAFLISPAKAETFDVLVIPVNITERKENYYNFDDISDIVANYIINDFNSSNGKIHSPELKNIRAELDINPQLKQTTNNSLKIYKKTNKIDYDSLKTIEQKFNCNYTLLVSSNVTTNANSPKRNIWEILEICTLFDISYPYRLETSLVLIDSSSNLIMWSNNYSTKIGDNENLFYAKNYAQAAEQLTKIELYTKSVIAKSASENIILRFFPKSVRTIETKIENNDGGALRFDKTIPQNPQEKKKLNKDDEEFFGEMIYGI